MALHKLDAECIDAKSRVRQFDREAEITAAVMDRLCPAIRDGMQSPHIRELRKNLWAEMEAEILGALISRLRIREEDVLGLLRGTHVIVRRGLSR